MMCVSCGEFWAAAPPVQNMVQVLLGFAKNIYIYVINLLLLYTLKYYICT